MNDEVVTLTTTPASDAPVIARALVERRLAACVNILPRVQSIYRWQGEVEEAEEALLVVKTLRPAQDGIEAALRELHPYEVYELLVLPIEDGSQSYLRWLRESIG